MESKENKAVEDKQSLFRKEAIDHISSPEQLTDYLRVTNPGTWAILLIVIAILISIIAWSTIGTLETTSDVKVVVKDHAAMVMSTSGAELTSGMQMHVSGRDAQLASARKDEYGRSVGVAEIELPDGIYDGSVVTEETHPIDFLLKASE